MIHIRIPNWLDIVFAWPFLAYRVLRYGYSFRRIFLDEGNWTILDQQDYRRFARFKWCIGGDNGNFYAIRGQRIGSDDLKIVRLHRLIMDAPDGILVDHINGNGLDNRRANLRLATHSQNQWNKRKMQNTTSRFVGVSFRENRRKWAAYIGVAGKRIWLGNFDSEIEAARVYDQAAMKYRGEFARLNFPQYLAGACPPKL
jgi:hypothetical protein